MMSSYEKAKKIIYENEDLIDSIPNISYELIEKAEKYLDIKFPNTFKQYLKDFGALTFGATEIYGVIDEDFINSSVPDAIWYTMKERKDFNLPKQFIGIYSLGEGTVFFLDTSKMKNNECPVVSMHTPNFLEDEFTEDVLTMEYDNFGDFLLEAIEDELEFQEEDDEFDDEDEFDED